MGEGSVTVAGLKELDAAIDKLPDAVTAALRGVAKDTAYRIQARARVLAPVGTEPRGKYTKGQPHLRDAIEVIEQSEQKQFLVDPNTPWLPNLALWIERGTTRMAARPFMRPAGDAENARYIADSTAVAEHVVTEALK